MRALCVVTFLLPWRVLGATFYVAPTGNDANTGSFDAPFYTIAKAVTLVAAGDTILVRGGTFTYSATIRLTNSGSAVAPIRLWAYADERPFLDFSSMADADANRAFLVTTNANFWHIKGLEIYRAGDNGMKVEGSGNVIENCSFHHCRDTGLQIGLADTTEDLNRQTAAGGLLVSSNQVINCDSYLNYDPRHGGGNADGFACKLNPGRGNVFKGCRSWENSDDGWDLFKSNYPIVLEDCWTWHNGDPASFSTNSAGNAGGFKLGGDSGYGANHVVRRCIAFNNRYGGSSAGRAYHQNDNNKGITLLNCLSVSNNYNYALNNDIPESHVVKNCVTIGGDTKSFTFTATTIQQSNSWNFSTNTLVANLADYFVFSEAAAKAPREPDGSLPNNGFARLVAGSDLIDKGVDVGLPFNGARPDLGPFEYQPQTEIFVEAVSVTETGAQVRVSGLTGHGPVIVHTSADMQTWTALATNPAAWGSQSFFDSGATNLPQRFYKVQEQ